MFKVTNTVLQQKRERFVKLINLIHRPDFNAEELVEYLNSINFFKAPATTQYACSFEGGLLIHALNVYDNFLIELSRYLMPNFKVSKWAMTFLSFVYEGLSKEETAEKGDAILEKIDKDDTDEYLSAATSLSYVLDNFTRIVNFHESVIILSLLSEIYKATLYERYAKNEKVYSEEGKLKDELGNYNWRAVLSYKVKDADKRDVLGSNGFYSYYEINKFLPLTKQEAVALTNQFTYSENLLNSGIPNILKNNPLTLLLNVSSNIATYITDAEYAKE